MELLRAFFTEWYHIVYKTYVEFLSFHGEYVTTKYHYELLNKVFSYAALTGLSHLYLFVI